MKLRNLIENISVSIFSEVDKINDYNKDTFVSSVDSVMKYAMSTDRLWKKVVDEDTLDELSDIGSDLEETPMLVSSLTKENLKKFDDDEINRWANIDYHLKEKQGIATMIDYDSGNIRLVRKRK